MYVSKFKHSLISIKKLAKDCNCAVNFLPKSCVIFDNNTREFKVVGHAREGLYYLDITLSPKSSNFDFIDVAITSGLYNLWHNRLGHAPSYKLKHIPEVKPYV